MKLKELHEDMERYLQQDCYCPHEIYSTDGFFYQLFYEDEECEKLGVAKGANTETVYCIVEETKEHKRAILEVVLCEDNNKIADITRYDATENNIEIVSRAIKNGIVDTLKWCKENNRNIDEFEKGSTAKSLKQLLELSNGIVMYD